MRISSCLLDERPAKSDDSAYFHVDNKFFAFNAQSPA